MSCIVAIGWNSAKHYREFIRLSRNRQSCDKPDQCPGHHRAFNIFLTAARPESPRVGEVSAMKPGPACHTMSVTSRAAECMNRSRELQARAERYRRLAESLLDPSIVAVVLACAHELEESAEALRQRPGGLAMPEDD